ncbi:MAG: hypothetical protein II943_00215 [Victivallales bacterium]|nr:hypothetical protein [Victivallales bacterium]
MTCLKPFPAKHAKKGLHHACHLRTLVRTARASLRSAQAPGCPNGLVHVGEDAGRAADGGVPRARRPKAPFRAVDGRAPARAKHGGFARQGFRVFSRVSRETPPGNLLLSETTMAS